MTRYDKRFWLLAIGLSATAGYVDAIGFLQLGGLFVSFMSGNSTRLAVGLAKWSGVAGVAAALIGSFLGGVVAGSLLAAGTGARRKPAVLGLLCLLLSAAAVLPSLGHASPTPFVLAAAMGAANCVFQRDGEVSIGVTYMTGTLVKLGQRLAALVLNGDRLGWLPYLLLWMGLVAGAVCGAAVFPRLGLGALWIAAAAAGALTLLAIRLGPAAPSTLRAAGPPRNAA